MAKRGASNDPRAAAAARLRRLIPIGAGLAILLVVMGVQFITMGLLAEMLARTYHESQKKPVYVVALDLLAEQDADEAGASLVAVSGAAKA